MVRNSVVRIACTMVLVGGVALLWAHGALPQDTMDMDHGNMQGGPRVPAYHKTPASGALPETLPPAEFANDSVTHNAYTLAAKVKGTLYQMPCYCNCDREAGHASLLDCYRGTHASVCLICKKELFYSYQELKKGKTAAQIRAGIVRGDWSKIDLTKWVGEPAPPSGGSK
jgi:Protein of unknown function with PCYCGC motif